MQSLHVVSRDAPSGGAFTFIGTLVSFGGHYGRRTAGRPD